MATSPERVRRAQSSLASRATREVASAWRRVSSMPADRMAAVMSEVLIGTAEKYGPAAGAIAADYYDEVRVAAGATGRFTPLVAALPTVERFESLAGWSVGPMFGADPDPSKALTKMSGGLTRIVQNVGRETIANAVASDPARPYYARHASANACAFCGMLASRGPIYVSSGSAGSVTGASLGGKDYRKMRETGMTREQILAGTRAKTVARGGRKGRETLREIGSDYHDDCHCTVVPVFPGQKYEEAPYVAKWREAYANAPHAAIRPTLSSMRDELGSN